MKTIKCESLNEGYQELIEELKKNATESNGRQQGTIHEILDVELELADPRKSVLSLPVRNMSRRYAAGECILYLKGSDKLEDFSFYSKSWNNLATKDKRINSAYGHRWLTSIPDNPSRIQFAIEQLVENPDTKNAIVMLRDDRDLFPELKDRCCTLCLCFNIRNNKLNMRTIMRSQDMWLGLPYDIFCFTRLQQIVLFNVNLARKENKIELGTYTHQILNLHVYEKHWSKICNYERIPLNTKEAYQFPEFDLHSNECLLALFNWEERLHKETDIEQLAYDLRELKLDPFCETLGSYLVNNITNNLPTIHDDEMFNLALRESKKSKCIDRQVGCVITDIDGNVLGTGCNTVINCNQNCHDKLHRICNVRHGEISALESISPSVKALAHTAYVTLYPCYPCMKALEKAGISCVKVKGFSHKGATGNVMLFDPEFFEE